MDNKVYFSLTFLSIDTNIAEKITQAAVKLAGPGTCYTVYYTDPLLDNEAPEGELNQDG